MLEIASPVQTPYLRLIAGTLILSASLGSGGCASGQRQSHAANATEAAQPSATDEQLADQVQVALHANPYLDDAHVKVSIEHGNIVLRGFVSNDWDLLRAKKTAAKAAAGRRVVDNLSINPIEPDNPGVRAGR